MELSVGMAQESARGLKEVSLYCTIAMMHSQRCRVHTHAGTSVCGEFSIDLRDEKLSQRAWMPQLTTGSTRLYGVT